MSLEAHNDLRKDLPLWDANEEHVVKVIREKWNLGQDFTADEIHTVRWFFIRLCGPFSIQPRRWLMYREIISFLISQFPQIFHVFWFLQLCGILEVNGFEIGDAHPFLGLFAVTSLIAHECVPNATHFENNDEGVMEVRAVVDMPAGTAITLCYDCALKVCATK